MLNLQARIRILEEQCDEKDAENLALQDDLAEAKKKVNDSSFTLESQQSLKLLKDKFSLVSLKLFVSLILATLLG